MCKIKLPKQNLLVTESGLRLLHEVDELEKKKVRLPRDVGSEKNRKNYINM